MRLIRLSQSVLTMTTQDHNKTLVILFGALAAFFTCGLLAAPWIIVKNYRHTEQIPLAIMIFSVVFLLASVMWSTVYAMHRRRPVGRKLALISAALALPFVWPVGAYAWWFMHSEGAKRMYEVTVDAS